MKRSILGSVAMACAVSAFVTAQTPAPSTQTSAAGSSAEKTMTLSGCIAPGMTLADPFTLTSVKRGYRLSGTGLSAYAGKRVRIVGGLVPSANAAATAGASSSGVIGQTGMSGAGSAGIGPPAMTTLPEFRVTSVKPIEGPCPPR